MPAKAPDNFAQIFPEHPHRRVHILFSILAFVLVAGSIVVYQIKTSGPRVGDDPGTTRDYSEVSDAYWDQVTIDSRELASTTPTITEDQWKKATDEARRLAEENNK